MFLKIETCYFYAKDLALTLSKDILLKRSKESIKVVNSLGKFCRWNREENTFCTEFIAPNIIMAYNKFTEGIN